MWTSQIGEIKENNMFQKDIPYFNTGRTRFKKGNPPPKHKNGCSCFRCSRIPWNKGKHHSEESKKLMSEIKKGKHYSPATELKKGHLMPQEVREKISQTMKEKGIGKKENNIQYGKHPWNWQGGITPLHCKIRSLLENREWIKKVLGRDNYTCQDCFIRKEKLAAHHKNKSFSQLLKEFLQLYSHFSPLEDKETLTRLAITYEPFWDVSNGQTLCEDCHNKYKKEIIING